MEVGWSSSGAIPGVMQVKASVIVDGDDTVLFNAEWEWEFNLVSHACHERMKGSGIICIDLIASHPVFKFHVGNHQM